MKVHCRASGIKLVQYYCIIHCIHWSHGNDYYDYNGNRGVVVLLCIEYMNKILVYHREDIDSGVPEQFLCINIVFVPVPPVSWHH
jgi:hypothetical protein